MSPAAMVEDILSTVTDGTAAQHCCYAVEYKIVFPVFRLGVRTRDR